MGKLHDSLDETLIAFIEKQHVFFVATAPLDAAGHVNVSPKGLDSFRVLGPRRVAYLDLTGSGIETVAHVKENGRLVIMFCAFEGAPKVLRLHGHARVVERGAEGFEALAARFPRHAGTRSIIVLDVERIADACGYAVPVMRYEHDRNQLDLWTERKDAQGALPAYREQKNLRSIDGLPGLERPEE